MNKKTKAAIITVALAGIVGTGIVSKRFLDNSPQPTPRPLLSVSQPSPTARPSVNPEPSPSSTPLKPKAQTTTQVKAASVPVVVPVAWGANAFAGDKLKLPDGTTYTVPPSTRIIFQKDVDDDGSNCHMTWQQVVKVTPREIPNQCRIQFGEVQWFFTRCYAERPLRDTPGEKLMAEKGYKTLPVEDLPDCKQARLSN
jgi:hypothetical protein